MSGLKVSLLLGGDSLPKSTLLEPPIQKGKKETTPLLHCF